MIIKSKDSKESELPVIDLVLGAEILGTEDIQKAKMMVQELVKLLPSDLEKVKAAYDAKDNTQLKNITHYIKGGVSFCGTPRLKKAVVELDELCNKTNSPIAIEAAYKNLCYEIEVLLTEYAKLTE